MTAGLYTRLLFWKTSSCQAVKLESTLLSFYINLLLLVVYEVRLDRLWFMVAFIDQLESCNFLASLEAGRKVVLCY